MHPVAFALLALFALLLISGGYMFVVACVRKKDLPWLVEEEIKKTSYGRFYGYMVSADQWLRGHNAQQVYIKSHDGLRLHALWIPAQDPKGTILLAHGYRSTKLADFSAAYDYYHRQGMNILVPDQRSHGLSEGRYITFGVKESKDMLGWIRFHNRTFGNFPVILSGLSMGASTMLYLADQDLPENVKGLIADCGFTSPKEILSSVFKSVIHLPAGPTVWAANLFAMLFAGFSLYEKDTRKALANSKLPVFMIHGTGDDFVPCSMTKQGYEACTSEKQLLLVEGAGHGVSFLEDKETYTAMLAQFLKKNIPNFSNFGG